MLNIFDELRALAHLSYCDFALDPERLLILLLQTFSLLTCDLGPVHAPQASLRAAFHRQLLLPGIMKVFAE